MNKYNDGKIYKIIDNTNGNIYIGSTCQHLTQRLAGHRREYKRFINGTFHFVTSFNIIENNDYTIELIELFSCNTKRELEAREGYHIRNNECVNKCMLLDMTKKEYNQMYCKANREKISQQSIQKCLEYREKLLQYQKQYYELNKEKLLQSQKKYREENKEKISQFQKKYRDENKEKLLQYNKEWRKSKKNSITEINI